MAPISRTITATISILLVAFAAAQTPQASKHHPAVAEHELFAPYWTAEAGWRTELQMRNNLAHGDLTVTPFLRTADGTEFPLPPVTIASNEIKSVDVSEAVTNSAPQLKGLYGSVVFRYYSEDMRNLYAAVMVYDQGHPIAFHMDAFAQATDYDTGSREGIWWLPNGTAKDYLVLTNKSQRPLQATLRLFDAAGKSSTQQVVLQPKTTVRNSVRTLIQKAGLTGAYGGFKIDVGSRVGSLDTAYLLFDEIVGFSALMKTFDRNPEGKIEQRLGFPEVKSWTTRAPMLALTNPDPSLGFPAGATLQPEVFVRNATAAPVAVALRFNWRSDTKNGSSIGPTLQLAPYETRLVDVAALQRSGTIPDQANWASVELSSSGRPNDIMATAASYDRTLRYGTQTPFNDQLTFHWEGGEWRVDATHNSIITAGNGGSAAAKTLFTIYYDSGKKRYDLEQVLKPHEQMWVDVGKLIHDQVPDKNGLLLPPDLTMGSYELQDLTDRGVGNLFEGKVIVDKTYGHVAYGCATCCGWNASPWMYYDPIGVGLGATSTQGVWDRDNCTSQDTSVLEYILDSSWNTGNHAIATASNAVITGVAVGSTTNSATGTLTIGNINALHCPQAPVSPSGPAQVQPTVTISGSGYLAMLNSGATGGGNTTTFTATGTPSGGTYAWTVISGQSYVTISNTTSQTVTVQSVAVGSFTVQATYTVNSQPGTAVAVGKVQQPGSLGVVSNDTQALACANLPGSYTTQERLIQYQVLDTSSPPVAVQALNMRASEVLAYNSNGCDTPPLNPTTNAVTGTNGYFPAPDMLAMCSVNCLPANSSGVPAGTCTDSVAQTWTVNGYAVKSDNVADTCIGPPTGAP